MRWGKLRPAATSVSISNIIAFFSFYAFALLMTWKIGRDQTHIGLSIEQKDYQRQLRDVLRIRSQIINVERYFLTKNTSNDTETAKIASHIRKKFAIQRKMDGFLPLNESIERHLNTAAQLRAGEKSTTLNVIAFLMALIGLPVSLMSMLLALSQNADIVREGTSAITRWPIAAFIVSTLMFTLILIAIAAAVSYAVIKRLRKIW